MALPDAIPSTNESGRLINPVGNFDGSAIGSGGSGASYGPGASVPKFAKIDAASSGDNTIVAAVTGKKIRVIKYSLVCAGAVTVTFASAAGTGTKLTGTMSFAANGGIADGFCPAGHFETAAGALLNMSLGGAVQVSGSLTYIEV